MCKKCFLLSVLFICVFQLQAQVANVSMFSAAFSGTFNQPLLIRPACIKAPIVDLKAPYPVVRQETIPAPVVHEAISETEDVMAQNLIGRFFAAMEKGSAAEVRNTCLKDARFQTHMQDQNGNHHIFDENIQDMVRFAASNGAGNYGVHIDYQLLPPDASASGYRAMYIFYLNGNISHCGVCSFELGKADDGWRIKRMIDTRSRKCN